MTIAPAVYCIVAETPTMAEEKAAYIEGLAHPLDSLVLLSEVLNFDFSKKGLDEPLIRNGLVKVAIPAGAVLGTLTGLIVGRWYRRGGRLPSPTE